MAGSLVCGHSRVLCPCSLYELAWDATPEFAIALTLGQLVNSKLSKHKDQCNVRDTTFSQESSDLSLAHRLASGSKSAWCDLVDIYGPLVDRWCRVSGVPIEAIPDIAQETFLATFRHIDRFDPSHERATFRGWLWTVTRNQIRAYFRKRQGRQPAIGGSTALQQVHEIADHIPLEDPSEATDIIALTQRAMAKIEAEFEPKTWQIFLDSTVAGQPSHVVAARYEVTPATVRKVRSRVLRRLRLEL